MRPLTLLLTFLVLAAAIPLVEARVVCPASNVCVGDFRSGCNGETGLRANPSNDLFLVAGGYQQCDSGGRVTHHGVRALYVGPESNAGVVAGESGGCHYVASVQAPAFSRYRAGECPASPPNPGWGDLLP